MDAKGCSQSCTRLFTWGSSDPTANAPTAASSSPTAIQPVRPVATYSRITNSPKKSSEVPRSRSRTRTMTLSSQIATRGPSTRPVGSWSRQTVRPVYARALRLAARYAAKKTARRILANSPGWKENPPTLIQILAPFTAGKKIGTISRTSAVATER